ncbi:DUF3885 domain-containing protein [Staphylococcus ratti]|uniref:DUF3885 domain-containing protein n=1 Tax=Staphylococcus ratti TaxID=2892440 RepID=A0ABY3PCJ7_9STAP|nr:DUF3885 domain-containing protein [Staphylococcus ratti]UEX90050.1 DUF3885 domain-containing protein [Staphylococcus ratti]
MNSNINVTKISDLNFFEMDSAFHLDLSEREHPFLEDRDSFNKIYFTKVHNNAIQILEDLFSISDTIDIVFVNYLYGDTYRKTRLKEKFSYFTKDELPRFKKYTNGDGVQCYELAYKNKSLKDINYKKLVRAICNQDFKGLSPSINQGVDYIEVYLINKTKNILYHLYDDRGLWLYFVNKELYLRYFQKYSDLAFDISDESD